MGGPEINIGTIIQARMGSKRFPGKVLKKIGSKSLLEHIFFRLGFLKHKAVIVLATSTGARDDVIERFCTERNIDYFRGSEENVLERYFLCAKQHGFDHIVRLTADNPFTDIEELDNLIDLHLRTGSDYSHSFGVLPVGAGAEIFTYGALDISLQKATKENHFEHVNEYIQENPDEFRIAVLSVGKGKNRPDVRLTVDTPEDLERVRRIVEALGDGYITTEEAIAAC